MGFRLSKIYTRTGDDGTTGLASGDRVAKTDPRVHAMGTVDELNCTIGLIRCESIESAAIRSTLGRLQNELFDLGAELSLPGHACITAQHVVRLEQDLDELNEALPPLKEFILPGGNRGAAACHMARALARRAERDVWALSSEHPQQATLLGYLNRLSDYLFVAARTLARENGGEEICWKPAPAPGPADDDIGTSDGPAE